jgi:hypothetical protein
MTDFYYDVNSTPLGAMQTYEVETVKGKGKGKVVPVLS